MAIVFEDQDDFERAVMQAIENRLNLNVYNDYGRVISVSITSSDGIVDKSDYDEISNGDD